MAPTVPHRRSRSRVVSYHVAGTVQHGPCTWPRCRIPTLLPPTSSEISDMDNGGIRQGSESAFPKAEYDRRVAFRAANFLAAARHRRQWS